MNQQALVWMRFPFSNLEDGKIRPAVVVSNTEYNRHGPDVVVCAVTSNLHEVPYSVAIDETNVSAGRLPIRSRIRADKIMHVEKTLLLRQFAKLDDDTFSLVIAQVEALLRKVGGPPFSADAEGTAS